MDQCLLWRLVRGLSRSYWSGVALCDSRHRLVLPLGRIPDRLVGSRLRGKVLSESIRRKRSAISARWSRRTVEWCAIRQFGVCWTHSGRSHPERRALADRSQRPATARRPIGLRGWFPPTCALRATHGLTSSTPLRIHGAACRYIGPPRCARSGARVIPPTASAPEVPASRPRLVIRSSRWSTPSTRRKRFRKSGSRCRDAVSLSTPSCTGIPPVRPYSSQGRWKLDQRGTTRTLELHADGLDDHRRVAALLGTFDRLVREMGKELSTTIPIARLADLSRVELDEITGAFESLRPSSQWPVWQIKGANTQ